MSPERVWTNSVFGRVLCTAFGVILVVMSFGVEPNEGKPWHGVNLVPDIAIVLVGLLVTTAVWTSRLVLSDGVLTATNFGVSRSILLAEVVDVDPSAFPFLGMKIRRRDRSGIRTLISGRAWNELWTSRAEKIMHEIEDLACAARVGSVAVVEARLGEEVPGSGGARYLATVGVVFVIGLTGVAVSVYAASKPWGGWDTHAVLGIVAGSALMLLAVGGFWARDA